MAIQSRDVADTEISRAAKNTPGTLYYVHRPPVLWQNTEISRAAKKNLFKKHTGKHDMYMQRLSHQRHNDDRFTEDIRRFTEGNRSFFSVLNRSAYRHLTNFEVH